jgi:hypothetical protein
MPATINPTGGLAQYATQSFMLADLAGKALVAAGGTGSDTILRKQIQTASTPAMVLADLTNNYVTVIQ